MSFRYRHHHTHLQLARMVGEDCFQMTIHVVRAHILKAQGYYTG